ncbi:MAG: hypothetical protein WC091_19910 [Sulfuricellaceae bacterium]
MTWIFNLSVHSSASSGVTATNKIRNTELRQVVRDAEIGKRIADALIQATLLTGAEEWVYIHIEVQGECEAGRLWQACKPSRG